MAAVVPLLNAAALQSMPCSRSVAFVGAAVSRHRRATIRTYGLILEPKSLPGRNFLAG